MRLDISVGISPRQPLEDWAGLAAALETEGVRRTWLIDSQLAMKDVYAGLLLAAQRTSRMQLGPGVTNPLTRHPTVTAGAIAALAEVSGGRALLGLGAGDSAVYGVGWRPAPVATVEAALRFFKAVLAGGDGEWEGRRHRLPHLPTPVPVWLAASRRRMCALGGRLADGVILMGPADAACVRRQVDWIEQGLAEAGRRREEVEISLVATTGALDDVRSWASTEARLLAGHAELPAHIERYREEFERARAGYDYSEHLSGHASHRAAVSDELTRALAVTGSAGERAERLAALKATGVDGFIFPLLPGDRLERLRSLRELAAART